MCGALFQSNRISEDGAKNPLIVYDTLYICFLRPDEGEYIILDLRKQYNGIYWYPFITSNIKTHVVSEVLGFIDEKNFAKANNYIQCLPGKTSRMFLL